MANKKINQLVAKTTILPTDLFPLGNPTTGQLFKKTVAELQAAIGGAVISVNGLVGTVVLDTDDIQELGSPTNKYFTDARARGAISLTVTGNSGASTYSNSTGVLNVPTYTLAGLGGITATFLSGASGIAYNSSTGVITYTGTVFTDASIRALVSAGAGLSYNSSTGVFSYSGTVYTDSSIRALISLTTSGSSGAATYNNTTGVLNIPTYTLAGLGGISLNSLSGSAPITYNSSTGAIGITQASGSTNGFLSSTDWNTFNGKQNTLTLGNVSEVVSNVLMFPDGQNGKTIGNLSIQVVQAGSTTNGFLSSSNWNTFNNKQNAITLTTTGTSGAATFSSGTLNIPNYGTALSGYLPLTGGTLTGALGGTSATFSSSVTGNNFVATGGNNVVILNAGTATTGWQQIAMTNTSGSTLLGVESSVNGILATGSLAYASVLRNYTNTALQFATNNIVRATITSAGNVGIGTTNPATASGSFTGLDIRGNTGASLVMGSTATLMSYLYTNVSGMALETTGTIPILFNPAGTERMRITSGGNVGIGTTSPNARLDIVGSIITRAGSGSGSLILQDTSANSKWEIGHQSNNLYFYNYTAGASSVTFASSGNTLLGTSTDNGERLYVSGSIRATGSITANSDVRLKKNIERIENALQKVSEISGYTYNTIYDEDRHAGVIAQEIDKVLPEIVNKGNDGLMGVEYGNISALLIEAIKDLKAKNDKLEAIVEGLRK